MNLFYFVKEKPTRLSLYISFMSDLTYFTGHHVKQEAALAVCVVGVSTSGLLGQGLEGWRLQGICHSTCSLLVIPQPEGSAFPSTPAEFWDDRDFRLSLTEACWWRYFPPRLPRVPPFQQGSHGTLNLGNLGKLKIGREEWYWGEGRNYENGPLKSPLWIPDLFWTIWFGFVWPTLHEISSDRMMVWVCTQKEGH